MSTHTVSTIKSRATLITIDISELESERENLFDFLKPKIRASITASGKALTIDPGEETLTSKDVKTFVKTISSSQRAI